MPRSLPGHPVSGLSIYAAIRANSPSNQADVVGGQKLISFGRGVPDQRSWQDHGTPPATPLTGGSAFRSRRELLLENFFLRQQLQVALQSRRRPYLRRHRSIPRSTRTRPNFGSQRSGGSSRPSTKQDRATAS